MAPALLASLCAYIYNVRNRPEVDHVWHWNPGLLEKEKPAAVTAAGE